MRRCGLRVTRQVALNVLSGLAEARPLCQRLSGPGGLAAPARGHLFRVFEPSTVKASQTVPEPSQASLPGLLFQESQNLPATCRRQVHFFKIGGIQSGHHLKKTRGLEPPPNPNWHQSSLDNSTFQTQIQTLHPSWLPGRLKLNKHEPPRPSPNLAPTCRRQVHVFKIGGIQSGHHLKKTRGLEPPPNPNWHRSSLDRSRLNLKEQIRRQERDQSLRDS